MPSSVSSRGSSSHLQKRVGKYFVGRTIGEGTYAKVKYGQNADSGEAVAIKVLDKEQLVRSGMVEQIKREITILKQIRHPHIVNLLEVMSSRDKIFMVMELVTGGELFDKVVAEGPMKEPTARRLFSQLLDAVGYCHQHGIYHRDLKPENVLLTSTGTVKLSDFGLGVLPNGGHDLLRTTCGTPNYVAPEVLAKQGYHGGPADVWSLGVVLYVVLAGCLPFDEDDLVSLFRKISAADYEAPPWLSDEAVALLASMLNPVPEQRPTVEQIWAHPWMRSGLVRRSVVGRHALASPGEVDIFARNVEPESIKTAYQDDATRRLQLNPSQRKINAFELLSSGLDISALFEARDDVVARWTRFSSRAPLATIIGSVEHATVAVGGRVTQQSKSRLRLSVPNPKGTMEVLIEVFELLPGTSMVDLQKVRGNTVEFYQWYANLTDVLSSIISKKHSGAEGDVGVRAASARRRQEQQAAGRLHTNAFELISGCFNIGALFEDEHATSRHVQFSSRRTPAEILAALEAGAEGMGGLFQKLGDMRAVLTLSVGNGRTIKLQAHLFEVLAGVHVCKLQKDAGSSMDFMRCYGQLASRLQPILMNRNAFPTAIHAGQLLAATASMTDLQRQAIAELPPGSPSTCSEASGMLDGAGDRASLPHPLGAVAVGGKAGSSVSRASLNSVPEETEQQDGSAHVGRSAWSSMGTMSSSSGTPLGGSPLAGGSPTVGTTWEPLSPVAEAPPGNGSAYPEEASPHDQAAKQSQAAGASSSLPGS